MESDLTLRLPREDEEEEVLRAHRATSPEVQSFLHYYEEGMPLSRYLSLLSAHERGISLPPDSVPETFLFAFVGSRIVGRVSIKHSLNQFLAQFGGQIGYVVVPEFRRRGLRDVKTSSVTAPCGPRSTPRCLPPRRPPSCSRARGWIGGVLMVVG